MNTVTEPLISTHSAAASSPWTNTLVLALTVRYSTCSQSWSNTSSPTSRKTGIIRRSFSSSALSASLRLPGGTASAFWTTSGLWKISSHTSLRQPINVLKTSSVICDSAFESSPILADLLPLSNARHAESAARTFGRVAPSSPGSCSSKSSSSFFALRSSGSPEPDAAAMATWPVFTSRLELPKRSIWLVWMSFTRLGGRPLTFELLSSLASYSSCLPFSAVRFSSRSLLSLISSSLCFSSSVHRLM
mmetsp:Transcript_9123/g.21472  ORF Transcript_9123/g.21472 Transcript_9123/m.21472 type:complete len:247 (-) Transcript_9123:2539-3279(-)